MRNCKYSIIIPCYNIADIVERTILSVLDQNNKAYEIIIINDGSTDNTVKIINRFAKETNVTIINKKNGGVSSARNIGIKKARGEYLLFLDGGDTLKANALDDIDKYLSQNIDMLSFGYEKTMGDKTELYISERYDNLNFTGEKFLLEYLQLKLKQCMCSFVVKRAIIQQNGIIFNERTYNGEDQEFQIKCILNCKKVKYLSDNLFQYIIEDNSATTSFSEKYLTLLDVFERLKFYIESRVNNKKLIAAFNNYALLEFFYVLRLSIKHGDRVLIKKVRNRDKIVQNFRTEVKMNLVSLIVVISKKIYLRTPNLLLRIYNKI